ncbi:alkyl hydroperoxide reductase/ Thiol specific antioxidant/ Mal allergen [Halosimplex carlsbadense 2-9-1]|uniref:Alkyl hydroperoxide reductase/ Thiol specific antioxidant/ Mal allergen n=1 Tax=Halosimplex carlsbadense 2-9-1 TaxID=797114 RepID=M0CGU4_9EURY|nr:redoxin domain-containing protein [Halosimplex carlsbadense]ELZ21094.1 alkyl hydroperoxide reductase/ Thiol specific antioxidant/ Mal allergen [Halosimplex carlsbadense 2-9-1]
MSSPDLDSGVVAPDFELPNVGNGPDPLSLDHVVDTVDFAVLLLLRDYHCPKCKNQVQTLAEEARQFAELNAVVLPILPEPVDRAADWQEQFDLPFPLLADPEKDIADKYDQPTQYGKLGELHDMIGRLPESVVLDTRGDEAEIVYTYEGESPGDRPEVETLLGEIDRLQETFVYDCSLVDC